MLDELLSKEEAEFRLCASGKFDPETIKRILSKIFTSVQPPAVTANDDAPDSDVPGPSGKFDRKL